MKPDTEEARPKPAVCRRLFDDDDDPRESDQGHRDNIYNQITEQINRDLDDACKKYNFDFRSERPLEGDWTWERIAPPEDDDASDPASRAEAQSPPVQPPVTTDPQQPLPPTDTPQPPTVPQ